MTQEQSKKFQYWQWRTIIGTMIGYIMFYLVRKNFSFAMPGLTAEYGISKTMLGGILTAAGLVYGISKFVNGVLADRTDGRWHLITGLTVCTITSYIFGIAATLVTWFTGVDCGATFINAFVVLLSILWIINNAFQGCGFPPCNRLITHWVPSSELATKMSIWNTSHSIGAFLASALCGIFIMGYLGTDMSADADTLARIAQNLGVSADAETGEYPTRVLEAAKHMGAWRLSFWIPAAIATLGIAFTIWCLRDTPKSVGLPELNSDHAKKEQTAEEKAEFKAFLSKHVFRNPVIWALALADFWVYIIRFAVLDWGPTFLQESRGLTATMAGWTVAIFEVFGVLGMLLWGIITDRVFGGRGQRTCLVCMVGAILFMLLFCLLPVSTSPVILLFILALAGMCIYGPQALIGVIASNQATRRAASTANGVVGMVSYISVTISGVGFGFISDHWGWEAVFIAMFIIAVIGLLTFVPMWNMKRDAYGEEE